MLLHSRSQAVGSVTGMPCPLWNAFSLAVLASKSYFSTTQYQLFVSAL